MLPASVPEADLLALIGQLNHNTAVHGILVQLPLPKSLDPQKVVAAIDPAKDVDGLHPINAGRLATGLPTLTPCTPLGCIILTKSVHASLQGMDADRDRSLQSRSGRPLLQLLLNENATVTIAHSRTRDLAVCRNADLIYAAVEREMVRGRLDQAGRDRHRRRHHPRAADLIGPA